MAVDDLGNPRIDFAWGNMPLQPNFTLFGGDSTSRIGNSLYPGDGEAEWIMRQQPRPSNQLQAIDNHVTALRHWKHYPEHSADGDLGYTLTVNWWTNDQPAYMYPNIIGLPLEEAIKQLKECGVNPAILVDTLFDAENPYDGNGGPILNAPGADNPGVIIWRYISPETVIGQHWDGSPWYAWESDGMVFDANQYPGDWVATEEYEPNYFSWWHSFVVLQTTDAGKNSYQWWD